MKIAAMYPRSLFSAWSVSEGIVDTLKRMGHEVFPIAIEPGAKTVSRCGVTQEKLEACDLILVSGPEHIALDWHYRDYVGQMFPEFEKLKVKKVAWLHETVERADFKTPIPVEQIKKRFDVVYTPAAQDEKYGLKWLPFGVDTEMFHWKDDDNWEPERHIDVAFIGLVYGPRKEFLAKLAPHIHGIKLTIGNCQVTDLGGLNIRKSVELYASELRRTKVLLCLPPLCRHSVTKLTEAAACGAAVLTEKMEDARNNFLDVGYYRDAEGCGNLIRHTLEKYEDVARVACEEVHKSHRLDQRLGVILNA